MVNIFKSKQFFKHRWSERISNDFYHKGHEVFHQEHEAEMIKFLC